jgi:hypothetical protein
MGENNNCRGWLLGVDPRNNEGKGEGMAQMFQMMNEARMKPDMLDFPVWPMHFKCCEYCKERIQGRPLTIPKVTGYHH